MSFKGVRKTFDCKQVNHGSVEEVFPLLCPVREFDWLDGWEYQMIHSSSGLIEKGCVFTTRMDGNVDTIWYVTDYNMKNYKIVFLRVTPGENVVKIDIQLRTMGTGKTEAEIHYQYTGLNVEQNRYIETDLEQDFYNSMAWWEKSINHYLEYGKMLRKGDLN